MPAVRRTATRAVSRTASRAQGSPINVEVRFRNVSRLGGTMTKFDLEVHPGSAVSMAIHASPATTADTTERSFLGPFTQTFRNLRVNAERPEFVFHDARGGEVAAVIHFGSGKPRAMEGDVEHVRVR